MTPDPYSRTLAAVTILKDNGTKVDIADLLIRVGLADRYYGGTKERTFMKNAPLDDAAKPAVQSTEPVEAPAQRASRQRKMPEVKEATHAATPATPATAESSDRPMKKTRRSKGN